MKKNQFSKRQHNFKETDIQRNPFRSYRKELKVYNKWQKIMLQECYEDFIDGGYLKIKNYTKTSITYEVSFRYKLNLNGFLDIFFANIRSGAPSWYK